MEDGELIEWVEKNSGTLQQWISLMQFGKATFEKKPALAMELIVREAERNRCGLPNWCVADRVCELMRQLGWEFYISG